MPVLLALAGLLLLLTNAQQPPPKPSTATNSSAATKPSALTKQLYAVRGQVVSIRGHGKGLLLITIKPRKEFAEVSVVARENDLVGRGVGASGEGGLLGLLTGESDEEETITAAELGEGDLVSVIYDPQTDNRAIEIYLH